MTSPVITLLSSPTTDAPVLPALLLPLTPHHTNTSPRTFGGLGPCL
jgi:hypothetical protein